MRSRIVFFAFLFIGLLVLPCIGEEESVSAEDFSVTSVDYEEPNVPPFPYVAQVVSDEVNIRSGPGTNYYSCGKLDKGARIIVIARKHSWSHIVPPAKSFSWISKQYVSVDPNFPDVGTVTGDSVRVYVGSPDRGPMHSEIVQVKRNKGDIVKLLGEEKDDYYKISPPEGGYLWVSTKFTKPLGGVDNFPVEQAPKHPEPALADEEPGIAEAEKLKEYYDLERRMKAELTKPADEQDYSAIKQSFSALAADQQAGKAARYCRFALKQIDRYELALEAGKTVELQDTRLAETMERIVQARKARLDAAVDLGRFSVIGKLQHSKVYAQQSGQKYYRIIDASGRMLCYALAKDTVQDSDLKRLIGRKVGLFGTIEPHRQTGAALVRFVKAVEIQ